MYDLVAETLGEVLPMVFYGVLTVALTVGGTAAEQSGIEALGAGQVFLGAWLIGVGALMIYAGLIQVGAGELLPRLRAKLA